jgi:hypothetical protein
MVWWSLRQIEQDANQRISYQLRENDEMADNNDHNMRDRINIVAASGSMVLVGSQARDLIMNIAGDDHELKDAMANISAAIEKSGSKDAADSWKDFLEEAAGKRSKSKLKAFWDRTVSLAPDIATLTTAVAKVATLMI